MRIVGLIFFTATLLLGVWVLIEANQVSGRSMGYLYGSLLVAGSVLMLVFALWQFVQDLRSRYGSGSREPLSQSTGPIGLTPEEKEMVFAQQREMTHYLERAMDKRELFECNGDAADAQEAEASYRIAIDACKAIGRIGRKKYKLSCYCAGMLCDLADLMRMQERDEEAKAMLEEVVDYYQQQSERIEGGWHFWLDWFQAERACRELAEIVRAEGNTSAALALEDKGRDWVVKFMGEGQ